MIRLRRGKPAGRGRTSGGSSAITAPPVRMISRAEDLVGRRVEMRVAAAQDRHGDPVREERAGVGRPVDAHREPRDHRGAHRREDATDPGRGPPSVIRRPSRPHDRHDPRRLEDGSVTGDEEDGGRELDLAQAPWDTPRPRR